MNLQMREICPGLTGLANSDQELSDAKINLPELLTIGVKLHASTFRDGIILSYMGSVPGKSHCGSKRNIRARL